MIPDLGQKYKGRPVARQPVSKDFTIFIPPLENPSTILSTTLKMSCNWLIVNAIFNQD
jgi:hypothetical protein